jgi:glycosyltransferase involved in cell wall biosynthesis
VFALLSHGEAAPLSPLEAMATELPLVVAKQRPFDEFLTDETGRLVEEAAPAQVAAAIGDYLADPALRATAGRAGRERVCRDFTWERIARQYLSPPATVGGLATPRLSVAASAGEGTGGA